MGFLSGSKVPRIPSVRLHRSWDSRLIQPNGGPIICPKGNTRSKLTPMSSRKSRSRTRFRAGIFCGIEVMGVGGPVAGDLDDDGIGAGLRKVVRAARFGVDASRGQGL